MSFQETPIREWFSWQEGFPDFSLFCYFCSVDFLHFYLLFCCHGLAIENLEVLEHVDHFDPQPLYRFKGPGKETE